MEFTPELAIKLNYVNLFYMGSIILSLIISSITQQHELVLWFFGFMGIGIFGQFILWFKTKKEFEREQKTKGMD